MKLLNGIFKYGSLEVIKIGDICQFSCRINISGNAEILLVPEEFRPRTQICHMTSFNAPLSSFSANAFISLWENEKLTIVTNELNASDFWASFIYMS